MMKSAIRNSQSAISNAFTLIELMVVIAIIILVAATALPTLTSLFTAGQDTQAFNVLSAQLSAARALAITQGTYAGVHVQMADNPDFAGKCYTAIVWDDPSTPVRTFDLAPAYQPIPMPGTMAFGQISSTYVTNGEYNDNELEDPSSSHLDDTSHWFETFYGFTTFTIIFNPSGEVVTRSGDTSGEIIFVPNDFGLFAKPDEDDDDFEETQLWRAPRTASDGIPNYYGVQAVTMFDYKVVRSMADEDDRKDYLDEFGQFMALNLYTGKFFTRE